ncbi:mCG145651, partial [Mus musculus]
RRPSPVEPSLISCTRPLCAPSHDHQSKPAAVDKPRTPSHGIQLELPSFPPRPGLDPARGPPTQFSDLPRLPGLSALSSWVPKSLRTRLPWSLQARGPTNPESVLAHPHPLTSDCAFPPLEQCPVADIHPQAWGKHSQYSLILPPQMARALWQRRPRTPLTPKQSIKDIFLSFSFY